jgi:hypothetical protein
MTRLALLLALALLAVWALRRRPEIPAEYDVQPVDPHLIWFDVFVRDYLRHQRMDRVEDRCVQKAHNRTARRRLAETYG